MNDETAIKLLTKTRLFMPIINQNNELKEYLINRYNDIPINKFTYKEVKYRLIHNIQQSLKILCESIKNVEIKY